MHVRPYIKVFLYYVKGGEEKGKKGKQNNIYVSERIKRQRGSKVLERLKSKINI